MKKIFYRVEEIAEFLFVSKQTIYNHIYQNTNFQSNIPLPPYIKINGRILFPVAEFETWLKNMPRH
jgi:predicted DNA-binding transcriptional regulator AlpA